MTGTVTVTVTGTRTTGVTTIALLHAVELLMQKNFGIVFAALGQLAAEISLIL